MSPQPKQLNRQNIFSTYEIARLLSVDIGSVIQWMNKGQLQGYRTPGGHRRVQRADFFSFLKTYSIPIPEVFSSDKKVVLIVEDEILIRLDLKHMIQELKIPSLEIAEAQDGYQAGRKIEQLAPALVVLDVRLPGVDGFQICRDLRARKGPEETRILVVSGQLTVAEQKNILEAGADEVLVKPVNPDIFKQKVWTLLHVPLAVPAMSGYGRRKADAKNAS